MTRRDRRTRSLAAAALAAGLIGASALTLSPAAVAAPTSPTTTPFTTPNTDSCPNKTSPPPPIDTSEAPEPGRAGPTPLPVPASPIGGGKLGNCGVVLPDKAPPVPADISATAWAIADLDTGRVLAAKDPHGRYRPASTIKVLLATVALRSLDLNKVVVGTQDDANADGTRVGIGPGGRYTNKQLMQALLMCSGNDAAHAIATQLGGEDATVAKMNDLAKRLHAMDTRAATPSGLDGPGMSVSAYDLATLFREAMTIPTFAEIVHTQQVDFPGYPADPNNPDDKDHPGFPIANDNHLLFDYDGDLGGKTGYTDDARQTFVTAAERNGHRLVVTLLKGDVLPIRPPEQAARLLDYGFALPADASVGTLPDETGTSANTGVALASPPPHDTPDASPPSDSHRGNWGTIGIIGGLVLVIALVIAGWSLTGRSRR
ncbi:D-alanyl-D-alanine carboxypeptidase (penicillin-binding protein 5/6) [Nocardia pseudobrasiliensis]|uniref:D-alanyl-D-alanine carboxypeptidase (Penicillin-binding protein 5/6) n=2 Tax=Nocardia pseudobrasiliensis TaxID=45979 RepID=A0A370I187_9NOCA|nr:D-alanyl-D-alanine carboxypeptidase (penicillin-binding protein 5/6) [Nocardia pseudobrasiliensis]